MKCDHIFHLTWLCAMHSQFAGVPFLYRTGFMGWVVSGNSVLETAHVMSNTDGLVRNKTRGTRHLYSWKGSFKTCLILSIYIKKTSYWKNTLFQRLTNELNTILRSWPFILLTKKACGKLYLLRSNRNNWYHLIMYILSARKYYLNIFHYILR